MDAVAPAGIGQGDLFVARDPIGVKPLYYAALPEGFLFGSEIMRQQGFVELLRAAQSCVPLAFDLVGAFTFGALLQRPAHEVAGAHVHASPGHLADLERDAPQDAAALDVDQDAGQAPSCAGRSSTLGEHRSTRAEQQSDCGGYKGLVHGFSESW